MTYSELDQEVLKELDKEVAKIRKLSWDDVHRLHMLCSILTTLWHPAMKSRMEGHKEAEHHHGSYLGEHEGKPGNPY